MPGKRISARTQIMRFRDLNKLNSCVSLPACMPSKVGCDLDCFEFHFNKLGTSLFLNYSLDLSAVDFTIHSSLLLSQLPYHKPRPTPRLRSNYFQPRLHPLLQLLDMGYNPHQSSCLLKVNEAADGAVQ